jgi:rubrerythrin
VSARLTRRRVLAAAAVPVGLAAVPGARALAAPPSDDAQKRSRASLAVALRIEQTAVVAYEAIANSGRLSGRATAVMRQLLDDDRQHAQQLAIALDSAGVKPSIPPRRANVPGLAAVHDDATATRFALALEGRSVGAYMQAVRLLTDANVLRTVAGAMGADGQHLVLLRELSGRPAVPGAFERGTHP